MIVNKFHNQEVPQKRKRMHVLLQTFRHGNIISRQEAAGEYLAFGCCFGHAYIGLWGLFWVREAGVVRMVGGRGKRKEVCV